MAGQRADRRALHIVAAADGEDQTVTGVTITGDQLDVGRRVVGIGVHGIRAVQVAGGREADVAHPQFGEGGHGRLSSSCRAEPTVIRCLIRRYGAPVGDRKSTRLNSSHVAISYAVFCLKKKNTTSRTRTS